MTNERFNPPQAVVRDVPAATRTPRSNTLAWVVAALALAQTLYLIAGGFVMGTFHLVDTAAMNPIVALPGLIAIVALVVGAIRLAWRGAGAWPFALATLGWGLSCVVSSWWLARWAVPSLALSVAGLVVALRGRRSVD